jgi:hypothetical protein
MFFIILLRLFDRVFGEESTGYIEERVSVTGGTSSSLQALASASFPSYPPNSLWVKGNKCGWLGIGDGMLNKATERFIQLLLPHSKMMHLLLTKHDAVSTQHRKSFEMNLRVLPVKMQMRYLKNPFNDCTSVLMATTFNYEANFKLVKASTPSNSIPLPEIDSYVVFMEPLEYFIVCLLKYPLASVECGHDTGSSAAKASSLSATKSALEKGPLVWARSNMYFYLLNSYLELLFPQPSDENLALHLPEGSELFMALAVDFWLDNSRVIKRNVPLSEEIKLKGVVASAYSSASLPFRHHQHIDTYPSPLESLLIDDADISGRSWTVMSLKSSLFLVTWLVQDKSLLHHCKSLPLVHHLRKPSSSGALAQISSHGAQSSIKFYLPHSLRILQSPLFENVKLIFIKGDVIDATKFYMAVEILLVYIQPWKAQDEAAYSLKWRNYVISNFHFYTTLLVLLLRSFSRMNLSTMSNVQSNGYIMMDLLERVLCVFTSDLNNLLDEILISTFLRLNNQPTSAAMTPLKTVANSSRADGLAALDEAEIDAAFAHHLDMFPDPNVIMCADAGLVNVRYQAREASKIIIESLYVSSEPLVHPNIFSRVYHYLFGAENQVPEAALKRSKNIIVMLTEVLCVVDPSILSNRKKANKNSQLDTLDADRNPLSHRLTDMGRQQILSGQKKCSKSAVQFRGDQMDRPPTSMEWKHLAQTLVNISKQWNTYLKLPLESSFTTQTWREVYLACLKNIHLTPDFLQKAFRINLRIFADIRITFILVLQILRFLHRVNIIGSLSLLLLATAFLTISYLKFNAYFLIA